ncbi:hypothetical protein [Streptomyces sp. NPDC016845]
MDRVPLLWTTSYAPTVPLVVRMASRRLLRLRCFLRELALMDHTGAGGY